MRLQQQQAVAHTVVPAAFRRAMVSLERPARSELGRCLKVCRRAAACVISDITMFVSDESIYALHVSIVCLVFTVHVLMDTTAPRAPSELMHLVHTGHCT